MELRTFVTEYDENLSGDSYIDPLGLLVVWSAFGEQIFHNRVNSISNDVRNYTLNLLNHALIRDLIDDDSVILNKWLEADIGDKHSLSFRQACLVYLENLFTYAMVSASAEQKVDTGGILGNTKARARLEEYVDPVLVLSHRKMAHLLVRQLGLGVSGRYKTPFMEIGFFDTNYHYHLPKSARLWEKAFLLFEQSPPLARLYREAKSHLTVLLKNCTLKSQVPLTHRLSEVPSTLVQAYRQALASQAHAGKETRSFWLELTGLDQGAAGALLKVLDSHTEQNTGALLSKQALFTQARELCDKDQEAMNITHILLLEPMLAESDLLFRLALHRRNQSAGEIEKLWRDLGRDEHTLPRTAANLQSVPSVQAVLKGSAIQRFKKILATATSQTFEEQLRGLLSYHASVMRSRGQYPWAELTADNRVKVHARTERLPSAEDRPQGHWVNSYYISQFRNLVDGFRGVKA